MFDIEHTKNTNQCLPGDKNRTHGVLFRYIYFEIKFLYKDYYTTISGSCDEVQSRKRKTIYYLVIYSFMIAVFPAYKGLITRMWHWGVSTPWTKYHPKEVPSKRVLSRFPISNGAKKTTNTFCRDKYGKQWLQDSLLKIKKKKY